MSGKIFFRQLRRNSKRTWLNILLLTAAIAFFVMSVNLYQNSLRNLETAEDAFTTIALVELYGEIDKYGNIVEQGSEGHIGKHPVAVKGYDLTDIVSAEGVIDYDLRSRYAAYIPGKAVLQGSSFAMNSKDILIFRVLGDEPMVIPISHKTSYFFEPFPSEVLYTAADVYQCDPDSYAHGILLSEEEEVYYADDIRRLNRSDICDKIILYPGVEYLACSPMGDHWLPQEGSHLLVNKYRDWALNPQFDDWGINGFYRTYSRFGDYVRQENGMDSRQPFFIWRWEDVQSDPELLDYWENAMKAAYINVRTYSVTLTNDVSGVAAFHMNGAYLKEGRAITREEYETGAKVCMVSDRQANYQGWKIGDKLDMSFFKTEGLTYRFSEYLSESYPVYHQHVDGFFDQNEYEIVGIYGQRELSGNSEVSASVLTLPWATIFIPEKSVQNTTPEAELPVHGNLLTIWLENGSIDCFLEQMDALGLTEYREDRYNPSFAFYDQGYSIIQPSLQAMNSTSKLLLILSSVFLLVVSALLAYFFAQNQKQSVGILRMLGGSKMQAMLGVLACGLLLVTVGALCGAVLGHCLCGTAGEGILNSQMEEQAITQPFRAFVLTEGASVAEQLSVHGIPSLTAAAGLAGAALFPLLLLCNLLAYIHKEPRELLPKAKQ